MSDTSVPLITDTNPASLVDLLLTEDGGAIQFKGVEVYMALSSQSLTVRKDKKINKSLGEFLLSSIVGAKIKSKNSYKETCFTMEIYMYVIYNGCCHNKKDGNGRKRKVISFEFFKNEPLCRKWTNAINSAIVGYIPLLIAENGSDVLPPPKQRHYLVFVNPVSGKGMGIKIWTKDVKPMLEEADIRIELCITQYMNHAKTQILDQDLSEFDGVMIVGGDGLIFEVINGIAARPDSAHIFATLPIIPIPGGTANGLVKSLLYECDERYSALNATFVAVKGTPSPFDLSRVVTKSGTVHHSFLILGWGLISDIDILSETMRRLGEIRLYIAAVYFIMKKRRYKGRLRMQLANSDNEGDVSSSSSPVNGEMNNPAASASGYQYSSGDIESRESLDSSTKWVTLEGEFVLVWVVQTSHATASMHSGPGASLSDGLFTIFVVREMSRIELLQMLIGADNGEHIFHPKVCFEIFMSLLIFKLVVHLNSGQDIQSSGLHSGASHRQGHLHVGWRSSGIWQTRSYHAAKCCQNPEVECLMMNCETILTY
jgi:diacylglycerol kinase family enzyme